MKPLIPTIALVAPTNPHPALPQLKGLPVLRLGFRPFYLCAALFAMLAVPVWVAAFLGLMEFQPSLPAMLWHAHEMLFGFAAMVIMGFLLTAVKAWTGLATPKGPLLGAFVLLWMAARVAAIAGPYWVYAVLDIALLPLVALALVRVLLVARNIRNLPLAAILILMAIANLVFHLSVIGVVEVPPVKPLYAALALIIMVESVMAGRVIPAFTISATPGLKLVSRPWLERLTLASTALGLALWVFAPNGWVALTVLALAAVLQLQRMWGWQPLLTRRRPILWILHATYAWIPVGLGLLALAQAGLVAQSSGIHALAVGATGGLIIGMITRTARGHTGRPLAVSRPEVLAYALVLTAAVLRVLLPLVVPSLTLMALVTSAVAWALAFGIYMTIYTPWLMRTRLDGKDG